MDLLGQSFPSMSFFNFRYMKLYAGCLIGFASATAFVGCGTQPRPQGPNTKDGVLPVHRTASRQLSQTLKGCPPWTLLRADDAVTRHNLLKCLDELAHHDTLTLRNAIEEFVSDRRAQNKYDVAEMSKLFLLNRYIFNVPAKSNMKEARFFGGWIGVPYDDADVDLLWPFKPQKDGELELIGEFGGYNGDVFQAVAEFDYFNTRFGRRARK